MTERHKQIVIGWWSQLPNYIVRGGNRLPTFLNTQAESNISKLLNVLLTEFNNVDAQLGDIQNAFDVDRATQNGLDRLGANINVSREGLTDGEYRNRIKERIARNSADGSLNSIITILQNQFDIEDITDIEIEELGNASIRVTIPVADVLTDSVETTFTFGEIDDFDLITGFSDEDEAQGGILGGTVSTDTLFDSYVNLMQEIKASGVSVQTVALGSMGFDGEGAVNGFADAEQTTGGIFGGVV